MFGREVIHISPDGLGVRGGWPSDVCLRVGRNRPADLFASLHVLEVGLAG